ncbi:ornithine cyclodeaminase family protein [Rhizorhabdus dicambivorans]|uniref:Ornithine cyclodeaminase n=1 Tax=Rhizorhabdus dicambivorans TaxID=1850238 RepID=A0A2A4FTT4_9SPHN|nr:hypothetical protein [Rhizorhabdus dicambivorans]ATE65776.1 ornithine cyclodeaminase [Rhizorhabdus dicambivorans]PCE41140.1 ornithine cyclodeaminase [Rhizorhabdus dicambivorans]
MIYLDANAIGRLSDQAALLAALKKAFGSVALQLSRAHYDLPQPGNVLLVMPSVDQRQVGVKLITVAPGRGRTGHPSVNGLYVLLDAETGDTVALLDAAALTVVRTAAVGALAASLLAPPDARTMLMIGTGALAEPLVRSHAAVRPLERVFIWGRDGRKAEAVATRLGGVVPRVEVIADLERGVSSSHIVCSATNSSQPLVRGAWVTPGSYVSLIGSFAPDMRETDDALMERARLVVDTPDALRESGDLIGPYQAGLLGPVKDLGELVRGGTPAEEKLRDIIAFKSVGVGMADLAVAQLLLAAATEIRSKILPIEIG